eukprot:NODE_4374_length_818_cov_45.065020_g4044_i0.p1 GENE.NODE_4374_length_818_cov_45.065020_g4044_i0~~NODE_4374_length_818_cov_45.065020_g4044_i0.p1  ORF type:complete len:256 (-),score=52.56 NODE_4374_length_818_cov_45.065020_g4044_i0:51-731(-)
MRESNEHLPVNHLALAFQTPGASHPDALKIRLLEQLLGTYTRDKGEAAYSCFARAIVMDAYDPHVGPFLAPSPRSHNPVHSLQAFWTSYADVGLLGFYCIAEPGKKYGHEFEDIIHYGLRELVRITQIISDEEFERAKNQLKVQTLLQLDGTTNIADDIGRQVLTFGSRTPLDVLFAQLDAISKEDLRQCAHEYIYDKDPVVSAIGSLTNVPDYDVMRRLTFSLRA